MTNVKIKRFKLTDDIKLNSNTVILPYRLDFNLEFNKNYISFFTQVLYYQKEKKQIIFGSHLQPITSEVTTDVKSKIVRGIKKIYSSAGFEYER